MSRVLKFCFLIFLTPFNQKELTLIYGGLIAMATSTAIVYFLAGGSQDGQYLAAFLQLLFSIAVWRAFYIKFNRIFIRNH